MMNKYYAKLYVKLHYIWYYVTHPKMYWYRLKLKNKHMRKVLDLFIRKTYGK